MTDVRGLGVGGLNCRCRGHAMLNILTIARSRPVAPVRHPSKAEPRERLTRNSVRRARLCGQTLEGSFSAVSKPNFASKYWLESSRRDLHNALLCTALQSQYFFVKIANFAKLNNF